MTHPFKVGDVVRCVDPTFSLTQGDYYSVKGVDFVGSEPLEAFVLVEDNDGNLDHFFASRFVFDWHHVAAPPSTDEVHETNAGFAPPADHSASEMLTEAATIVAGERNNTNQHPDDGKERSFVAIAALWEAYLGARRDGHEAPVTARDVAWMMVLLKIARSTHSAPVRDHFVDAAGYAAIAGEIAMVTTK